MDARLQKRVQRYGWDKAASFYEQFWAEQLAPAQACMLDLAEIHPGEEVLDVACGTALVTKPAALAPGPKGRLLSNDISQKMVDMLAEQLEQEDLGHVSLARMDAENLDFPDESFDVIVDHEEEDLRGGQQKIVAFESCFTERVYLALPRPRVAHGDLPAAKVVRRAYHPGVTFEQQATAFLVVLRGVGKRQ